MMRNTVAKRITSIITSAMLLVLFLLEIVTVSVGAETTSFTIRTTAPSDSNPYYIHYTKGGYNECVLISGDSSCLPNCVGYAWGRAYEAMGTRPNLCKNHAKYWWSYNIDNHVYPYDSNPAPGSIACYNYGDYGHVLFIENVVDGEVYFSESEYGGVRFRYDHRSVAGMQTYRSGFQGYIHLDDIGHPTGGNPIGVLELAECVDGKVHIIGWAFDWDNPTVSIEIHVYIGGENAPAGGEGHGGIIANNKRDDVNEAYGITGNHGFDVYINTERTGQQGVYCWGINIGEGGNARFGDSTVNITSHQHSYTAAVTAPTCTERGYTTHTCTCGDSYVDTYVAALGHSYGGWITTTEATCTKDGAKTRTCSRCGETEAETIAPIGHKWGNWRVTKEATCTKAGEESRTCGNCEEKETRVIAALGHDYFVEITAPSCTEAGFKVYTCRRCGYSYSEAGAPATGHNWDAGEITVAPTTSKPGIITYTCALCGETRMEILPVIDRAKGDPDNDGEITVADALTALRLAAKLASGAAPEMVAVCDVDGDGAITVADALAILRVAAKLVDSL